MPQPKDIQSSLSHAHRPAFALLSMFPLPKRSASEPAPLPTRHTHQRMVRSVGALHSQAPGIPGQCSSSHPPPWVTDEWQTSAHWQCQGLRGHSPAGCPRQVEWGCLGAPQDRAKSRVRREDQTPPSQSCRVDTWKKQAGMGQGGV